VNVPIGIGPMTTSTSMPSTGWGEGNEALGPASTTTNTGNVQWDIAKGVRCDIAAFSGMNLSGKRTLVQIFAYGGLQGGGLNASNLASAAIVAPIGTRVIFSTSRDGSDYAGHAWRCVDLIEGSTYETSEGRTAVRIPDLDVLTAYDARRVDPDFLVGYSRVDSPEDSTQWSVGGHTRAPLKGAVRHIRIEKLPSDD
jgi:hypothetical protein